MLIATVMSTSGGMGKEMDVLVRQIATKLSVLRGEEVCSDVQIEPPLLPLTGEKLPHGSNTTPGARLDVSSRNLWSPLAKAFIHVRIFNPQAKTNWDRSIPQMYTSHENEKKTEYLPRVLQVVFNTIQITKLIYLF